MIYSEINNNNILLELRVAPVYILYRVLILLLALLCTILSIGILFLGNANLLGRILVAVALGFFVAFLFKSLLWNTYGKEVYEISKSEFTSYNDYGWYKDKKKTIPLPQNFELFYIDTEFQNTTLPLNDLIQLHHKRDYKLVFSVDGTLRESVVEHKEQDIKQFLMLLPEFRKIYQPVNLTPV
ncbi:hypothetical protein [Flavobacterium rivuli]|uniref:hypothetical protein n=1 Tax=Flavobacterium rivuli TaxID=498301 RepID=UPI00039D400A|nr:hypothetical protein [Flavobacterium rivuli]